jgi:hypothetical protein
MSLLEILHGCKRIVGKRSLLGQQHSTSIDSGINIATAMLRYFSFLLLLSSSIVALSIHSEDTDPSFTPSKYALSSESYRTLGEFSNDDEGRVRAINEILAPKAGRPSKDFWERMENKLVLKKHRRMKH